MVYVRKQGYRRESTSIDRAKPKTAPIVLRTGSDGRLDAPRCHCEPTRLLSEPSRAWQSRRFRYPFGRSLGRLRRLVARPECRHPGPPSADLGAPAIPSPLRSPRLCGECRPRRRRPPLICACPPLAGSSAFICVHRRLRIPTLCAPRSLSPPARSHLSPPRSPAAGWPPRSSCAQADSWRRTCRRRRSWPRNLRSCRDKRCS